MSEHDEFLKQATLCVSIAHTVEDAGYKAGLLEMAERWRKLAMRASLRETHPPSPPQHETQRS
jgi:hypothetical protein